jgi:hypothetical protein
VAAEAARASPESALDADALAARSSCRPAAVGSQRAVKRPSSPTRTEATGTHPWRRVLRRSIATCRPASAADLPLMRVARPTHAPDATSIEI